MATLIFKPTEACNAACAYCEVDRKGWRKSEIMEIETLELLFVRINEFLLEREYEEMEIIWHGGEPLLLGEKYFSSAIEFQKKHCAATFGRIRHSIQSNITMFSERFTRVFQRMGISNIGTSYDPVEGVRSLRTGGSPEYNKHFMNSVKLLEKEGFGWGVIYVVTKLSLDRPLDIFYFMTNLAPYGRVMFNPVSLSNPSDKHLKISPEEFTEFLGAIFPAWWRQKERYQSVEPFRSMLKGLTSKGRRTFFCTDSGNCANTHINLGPDGRWSHCGRSVDWGVLDYGTIFDRTISQVFSSCERDELRRRNDVLVDGDCRGCQYWPMCHGGCPVDAYLNSGSLMRKTGWCHSKRHLLERYFLPVTGKTHNIAL